MSRLTLLTVSLVLSPVVVALSQTAPPPTSSQPQLQQAIIPPTTFNSTGATSGRTGYSGAGTTAAGSAMTGMANVVSARGDYNLATSQAAINLTVAESQQIQVRQQATDAYFQMRAANRAYVAAEQGPRPSTEMLARIAAEGAPKPLNATEVNPVSGKVSWPTLLQDSSFAAERGQVEQLMSTQARYGRLGLSDMQIAGETIDNMSDKLAAVIDKVPGQQYMTCKNFLKSLKYNLTQT